MFQIRCHFALVHIESTERFITSSLRQAAIAMRREKAITVKEALEMLERDDFSDSDTELVDIVALPPPVDDLTDEEEEFDDITTRDAADLDVPGFVEAHIRTKEASPAPEPSTSGVSEPGSSKKRKVSTSQPKWRKKRPEYTKLAEQTAGASQRLQTLKKKLEDTSPVKVFEEMFSETMYDHIIRETLRYAAATKNDPLFSMTTGELKTFIGILLLSGYHQLPSERHYWSSEDDLGVESIRRAMSRSRYLKIKAYLHFQDNEKNSMNQDDRGFKIRPLMDMLNESFRKFGVFREELSVDEMLVRYFGHHPLKQFIKGKPIRFGYKMWSLCGSDGYCYKFQLYCGKETGPKKDLPLGTRVVTEMLEAVDTPTDHSIYFDNLFTSRQLMVTLAEEGYRATGTVQERRTAHCPLPESKVMAKTDRGTFETWFDTSEEIAVTRWNDNRCVTVMSNFDSDQPPSRVKRWDRSLRAHKYVEQPRMINNYNKFMGGVDAHDWLCGKYSTSIRGKKWYWCLFTRLVDMSVVNAWILHRHTTENPLSLLDFRRHIAVAYLRLLGVRNLRALPPAGVIPDVRFDQVGHFIAMGDKQRRCKGQGCSSKPRSYCEKCCAVLCIPCFKPYHTK